MTAKRNPAAGNDGASVDQLAGRSAVESSAVDLIAMPRAEFDVWLIGYAAECAVHASEEARAAALHHHAYNVVQAMAKVPPRDAQADAERAAQRAEWWAERRSA